MIWLEKINADAHQEHRLLIEGGDVVLTLRYHPAPQIWAMDVSYSGVAAYGLKLTLGTLHVRAANLPLDFVVQDTSGTGIDPFLDDDFESGRCRLWMVTAAEMREIRGVEVPL